jgi:hypothetical protein
MCKIEYILIHDSLPEGSSIKSRHRSDRNCGYHYVVNSEGVVLNPIDIGLAGQMPLKPREPIQRIFFSTLNDCSIGIQYNGSLSADLQLSTPNPQLSTLLGLLVELRAYFPSAAILGVDEIDRWHTRVSPTMNQLRDKLSYLP